MVHAVSPWRATYTTGSASFISTSNTDKSARQVAD
jgi:hypothetical protein